MFPLFRSTQKVCSYECSLIHIEREKERKKRDSENIDKLIQEKKDRSRLPTALKTTKQVVHEYVRLRDEGKPCISCGTPYKDDFDAGHFYPSGKFTSIRFDLDNISGQCQKCNRMNEGEFELYSLNLPNRIGQERYDSLVKRAELSKKFTKKWTLFELKEIREQIKKLKSEL